MSGLAERARSAIADENLQRALTNLTGVLEHVGRAARSDQGLVERRTLAHRVRRETLSDLDGWIGRLEQRLGELGVVVHHAATPDDACEVVVDIARREGVDLVVKAKSMATEEIHLNAALERHGITAVETDLGEYIVQLAGETPSHIVGPALHKRIPEIAALFSEVAGRPVPEDPEALCAFAREELRGRFLDAGMGVTGANFVAADTGTLVLVTNEGNGRMCTSLPRLHVAIVPVEKVVPRLSDVASMIPVLTKHASGQTITTYVSMLTGPRRPGEIDGPEQMHVVLLDHNRRRLAGSPYEEMLACIRCGACLNACPVYAKIGGHAYDSVYSGPMGAVLTPLLSAGSEGSELPDASTLCGACTEACPVGIPLADYLVMLRADARRRAGPDWPARPAPARATLRRSAFALWSRAWSSPFGYRATTGLARRAGRLLAGRGRASGWSAHLPAPGWIQGRDAPVPAPRSFRELWEERGADPQVGRRG